MNKYIVKIISTVDSSLKQDIIIDAYSFMSKVFHYEFMDDNGFAIACFPIERTIILRVKEKE